MIAAAIRATAAPNHFQSAWARLDQAAEKSTWVSTTPSNSAVTSARNQTEPTSRESGSITKPSAGDRDRSSGEPLQIRVDHQLCELPERDARLPAQLRVSLGGVAHEMVDQIGRAHV